MLSSLRCATKTFSSDEFLDTKTCKNEAKLYSINRRKTVGNRAGCKVQPDRTDQPANRRRSGTGLPVRFQLCFQPTFPTLPPVTDKNFKSSKANPSWSSFVHASLNWSISFARSMNWSLFIWIIFSAFSFWGWGWAWAGVRIMPYRHAHLVNHTIKVWLTMKIIRSICHSKRPRN